MSQKSSGMQLPLFVPKALTSDTWEAGELIRDPYSGAAKGEVALTLCYLWDFALPRESSFPRIKFVT